LIDADELGVDPDRIPRCSAVFRLIRDASADAGKLMFRIVTDRAVSGRSFEELYSQRFRVGVGEDLTDLSLLDLQLVHEMVQHDLRYKSIPEGYRSTVVARDDINEAGARKLLDELRQMPGIEISD
jgi:hypothetical protein